MRPETAQSATGPQVTAPFDAGSLFLASARRFGDRVALRDRNATLTYAGLLKRASSRLAAGLAALGVAPGERVLLLPNGARFIESWWAVVLAGAVVVPVNPRAAPEELPFYAQDSGARCEILGAGHLALMQGLRSLPQILVCADAPSAGAAIVSRRILDCARGL